MLLPSGDIPVKKDNYWIVNLILLWVSQLLILAGFSAMMPFIPLYMKNDLGVTVESELKLATAMFAFAGTLGYAISTPVWGKLADRFGVKPMLLRGSFATCFFFPTMAYTAQLSAKLHNWMPFVTATGLLITLRTVTAALAGTTSAAQMMIVRTVPENRQGFALGTLTTATWGGAMLGNVIGGLIIDRHGYIPTFWMCGILYFVAGIAIIFTRDIPRQKAALAINVNKHKMKRLMPGFTHAVLIMFGLFLLMGFVRNFELPYITLRIATLTDKPEYWTGIISAVVCAVAVLSGVVTGWMCDRYKPWVILLPGLTIAALALALQGWAPNLFCFALGRALLYTAAGGFQPVLQKTLSSITPKRKRGGVFGFASSMGSAGGMLSALVAGYASLYFGYRGVFYIAALLMLISLPIILSSLKIATRPPRFHRRR